MTMRIYTIYGRLAEQHDEAIEFHQRTLQLLRDVVTGKVEPSQLRITDVGWSVATPEPKDADPNADLDGH